MNWLIDVDRDLVMPWRSGKWQKSMALLFEFTTVTLPRQASLGTRTQQFSSRSSLLVLNSMLLIVTCCRFFHLQSIVTYLLVDAVLLMHP